LSLFSVSKFSPPTYLSPPHFLPPSPHFLLTPLPALGKAPKLEWLRASRRHEIQGLRKVGSSMLKECEKKKARGAFHPEHKSRRRKVSSLLSLHSFSSIFCFFFYLRTRR